MYRYLVQHQTIRALSLSTASSNTLTIRLRSPEGMLTSYLRTITGDTIATTFVWSSYGTSSVPQESNAVNNHTVSKEDEDIVSWAQRLHCHETYQRDWLDVFIACSPVVRQNAVRNRLADLPLWIHHQIQSPRFNFASAVSP
jgi:hypothetical protein